MKYEKVRLVLEAFQMMLTFIKNPSKDLVEAIDRAIELVNLCIPMRVVKCDHKHFDSYCPRCGMLFESSSADYKHCPTCGQALDWSVKE